MQYSHIESMPDMTKNACETQIEIVQDSQFQLQKDIVIQMKDEGDNKKNKSPKHSQIFLKSIRGRQWLDNSQFSLIEIKLENFLYMISSTQKIYSTILTDSYGNILFANKLASQHFQGSLNSFSTHSIQQLVIQPHRQKFVELISKHMGEEYWINYLTYSKSAKRKYGLYEQLERNSDKGNIINIYDLYFRYLKVMKSNVQPLKIKFTKNNKIEGYFNETLINKKKGTEKFIPCFFFKNCYSEVLPPMNMKILLKDQTIQKFLKSTERKRDVANQSQEKIGLNYPSDLHERLMEKQNRVLEKKRKMIRSMRILKKREISRVYFQARKLLKLQGKQQQQSIPLKPTKPISKKRQKIIQLRKKRKYIRRKGVYNAKKSEQIHPVRCQKRPQFQMIDQNLEQARYQSLESHFEDKRQRNIHRNIIFEDNMSIESRQQQSNIDFFESYSPQLHIQVQQCSQFSELSAQKSNFISQAPQICSSIIFDPIESFLN